MHFLQLFEFRYSVMVTGKKAKKTVKKTLTFKATVKKAILKSAVQAEYNKIDVVIVGDTKDLKAGDFKVTNTATNGTVAVQAVSAKKGAENTYVIETFTGMTDAKEYSVEYAGSVATFTATDNTVDTVALTKTEVPAGIKTEVKAVTKDAKGVILGYFDLTNPSSAKGQVTTALTITKGYVQGSDVYLPAVGDTMVAKLTYHTGSFATDGTETGIKEATATITAVEPSTVTYNYAVTFGTSAPTWTATSFKAVTAIKVGDASKKAYFRITDENGKEIDSYTGYTVETADPTKLVVNAAELANVKTTGTAVKGVAAGDTYILVQKDGNVVFSLPVQVQGKAVATSINLDKTSVTVMSGTDFVGKKLGTYTYKITLKDADKKAIVRTFTINYVDKAAVQAYQLKMPTEIDTTVKADTADDSAYELCAWIVETANGATIGDYQGSDAVDNENAEATTVTYTIKDKDGKDVTGDFVDTYDADGTHGLSIQTVSGSSVKYQKNLAAGTYYVTAKFKAKTKKADGTYDATSKLREVTVSGSFTVKDSQDTAAQIDVKKNDLNGMSVTAALQDKNFIEVTYDGVSQTLTGDVHKVNGTIAGNTAYVTSVEVYVQLTNTNASGTHNKVLITIPVNRTFTHVASNAL